MGRGRAPFNNSAPLGGGGVPRRTPTHPGPPTPPPTPPFKRMGQIFFRAFCRPKVFFGAFGASKNSAPAGGGGVWTPPLQGALHRGIAPRLGTPQRCRGRTLAAPTMNGQCTRPPLPVCPDTCAKDVVEQLMTEGGGRDPDLMVANLKFRPFLVHKLFSSVRPTSGSPLQDNFWITFDGMRTLPLHMPKHVAEDGGGWGEGVRPQHSVALPRASQNVRARAQWSVGPPVCDGGPPQH